jgi:Methyltransferase domain
VEQTRTALDPYVHDPLRWGASMVHHAEVLLPCLDAVGARSVAEVGAYAGDLTRVLVDWATRSDARVVAIDPSPQPQLVSLAAEHAELELICETSLEAIPRIAMPDALIIDGDHNYYTVREELRLVAERAPGANLPLLLFHDVCWPHGRRDDYFAPDQIPEDYRRPIVGEGGGIAPGDPGVHPGGLPYLRSAVVEGGPRNGVLTAVEDFVSEHHGLHLVVIDAFFGFGAVWAKDALWTEEVAQVVDPWDRNPLLRRLEENRVFHLAQEHALQVEITKLQERQARQEKVLTRLLVSRAFSVAERLSRLRVRAGIATDQSLISKDEIREALVDT